MSVHELSTLAASLLAPGKGILAADESTGTIAKRFTQIGVENSEEQRRAYRELLFTADNLNQYVSGVILYEETLSQTASSGVKFADLLATQGILPGIKVDKGTKPLAGSPQELITEGLDGLRERLTAYKSQGAKFAKWRAVITISGTLPSAYCIRTNAQALARYAALCQEAGILPIVEPEVLMDGDHTLARTFEVTRETLHTVFNELHHQNVDFRHLLLKPNMIVPGAACKQLASVEQVAEQTLRCFYEVVPAAVPGIVFLSGGQSDELATAHLNAMNQGGARHPWRLSFSYGRALQQAALKAWSGQANKVTSAQKAFLHRAKCNSLATAGTYTPALENQG